MARSCGGRIEDAVIHVWMAGEPYEQTDEGFLGVTMGVTSGRMRPMAFPSKHTQARGFDAYRALENGDIVIGVVEAPLPAPSPPADSPWRSASAARAVWFT